MSSWLIRLSKKRSRQGLYEFLEKQFSLIQPEDRVLTVGAGGKVTELLVEFSKQNSFQVTTFDINEKRNPDIAGDFCTYDFKDFKVDVVVLAEVLQFFKNPQIGIENAQKILKPGGRLILTTPFIFPIHDRPYDLYRFTKHGLKFLLSDFESVTISEKNSALESIDVLWLRLNKIKGKHSYSLKRIIVFTVYYIKRPLTLFLIRYIKTDIMTTGYNVVAFKKLSKYSLSN
ncbi:MAG: methyltransferase domain-containing protein [Balneolaceae bacterium]|nr:methyltransferase domain-containing protein [Balneolaceae bacterium]